MIMPSPSPDHCRPGATNLGLGSDWSCDGLVDCRSGLTGVVFRDRASGSSRYYATRYLFLFIGADQAMGIDATRVQPGSVGAERSS